MIQIPGRFAAIVMMSGLAACASVMSGTSQTLTLDTIPSGADCSLTRKGLVIGRVNPTPGAVDVQRTHDDITVSCTKEGYEPGSFLNKSGFEVGTLGNIIIFGGLTGVIIDYASGADNRYDEKVRIVLAPTEDTLRATLPPDGALAATAEFRCPVAGTVFKNSSGGQLTFTDADGFRCRYTDETGQKHERYAIFADGYGKLARKEMDTLWPLKVGNSVSFHVSNWNTQPSDRYIVRDLEENFSVNRQERVTVPAGTFDTFVIEWNEEETGPNPTGALTTLWYSPGVGYVVKSTVHMLDTNEISSVGAARYVGLTYDATEIGMPNGGPVPVATAKPVAPKP